MTVGPHGQTDGVEIIEPLCVCGAYRIPTGSVGVAVVNTGGFHGRDRCADERVPIHAPPEGLTPMPR